jgi:glycosyltransferase involved in cell wall biosynthesis
VVRRLGIPVERIRIIPNWADGKVVRPVPAEKNDLRRAWDLGNTFVVGYSGNLGRAHDIATIVDAMALTQASSVNRTGTLRLAVGASPIQEPAPVKPITWLFVGGGAKMGVLRGEAVRRHYDRVQFQVYQARERLAESLSVPDVHLITLKPELEGLIVPSKFYGIAAAGRPAIFIGDPEGEIGRILTRTQTGVVVAAGDSDGLAQAVLSLAREPRLALEYGQRARALLERAYDLPFAVAAWEEVIAHVSARSRVEVKL